MHTVKQRILLILIALLFGQRLCHAEFEELPLKAMFLDATTRFITWPDTAGTNLPAFSDSTQPFIIGVMGEDSIYPVLKKTFSKPLIKGKQVEVKIITAVSEIPQCHMLYIPISQKKALDIIMPITQNRPILTVGDTPGYSEQGVILNLYLEGSKVRFKINESAARQSGLKISYLLLKMGKVVNPVGGSE